MCFVALFNLAGGEIILILALTLIVLGAKKLPDFAEGLRRGSEEFEGERSNEKQEERLRAFLMTLIFILGAACFILVLHEFSK